MKGIDTPILLSILRGRSAVLPLLGQLKGGELATTEWNLLELDRLARSDPHPGRERRLSALARLRRVVTVLPIDEQASRRAARWTGRGVGGTSLLEAAMLGAVEAAGGDEWWTLDHLPGEGTKRAKVRRIRLGVSK